MKTSFVFIFRRHLQDILIKTNIFALVMRLQKTSSRRLSKDQYIRLGHTSSKRLQDVFPRCLQDVFQTKTSFSCKKIFKTSSRHLREIFEKSSRRPAKMSSRRFRDVSSSYSVLVIKFSRCLQDAFTTFLRRTAKTVIYRKICLGHTSEKFMVSVQNLQE